MLQKLALRKGFPTEEERQTAINDRRYTKRYLKCMGTIGGLATLLWGYEGMLGTNVVREQTGACAIACGVVATIAAVRSSYKSAEITFRDKVVMNSMARSEAFEKLDELLPQLELLYEQPTQGPTILEKV